MKSAMQEATLETFEATTDITIQLPEGANPIHVREGDCVYWQYEEAFTVLIDSPMLSPTLLESNESFRAGPALAEKAGKCTCTYKLGNSKERYDEDFVANAPPPNVIIVDPSAN